MCIFIEECLKEIFLRVFFYKKKSSENILNIIKDPKNFAKNTFVFLQNLKGAFFEKFKFFTNLLNSRKI